MNDSNYQQMLNKALADIEAQNTLKDNPNFPDWVDSDSEDAVAAYANALGMDVFEVCEDDFWESYVGEYDGGPNFVECLVTETENLDAIPDYLWYCVDWERVWESYFQFDYFEENGYFFRNL